MDRKFSCSVFQTSLKEIDVFNTRDRFSPSRYLMVYNSVEELKKYGDLNTDYPLSQLTISIGFFFVYFLEEFSHWFLSKVPQEPPTCKPRINNFTKASVSPHDSGISTKTSNAFLIEDEYDKAKEAEDSDSVNKVEIRSLKKTLSIDEDHESIVYDTLSLNSEVEKENAKNLDLDQRTLANPVSDLAETETEKTDKEVAELKEEIVQHNIKTKQQIMRGILVVLALSFHAIFEGLAIGLQNKAADIWYLFVAVSIHSATILFCIGLELLLARAKTKFIVCHMLVLALASPFGIIVGIYVTKNFDMETKAKSSAVVLLEGFSAGTILYITFFEVLNREKERRVCRIKRALCITAGFSLMAFLQYLETYGIVFHGSNDSVYSSLNHSA